MIKESGEYGLLQLSAKDMELTDNEIAGIARGLLLSSPYSETTGELNTNIAFERINQSITIILNTAFKEVPMLPILGSDIDSLLFEQLDTQFEEMLKTYLNNALVGLEARVTIKGCEIVSDKDGSKSTLTMTYVLTGTNIANQFKYSIARLNGGDQL